MRSTCGVRWSTASARSFRWVYVVSLRRESRAVGEGASLNWGGDFVDPGLRLRRTKERAGRSVYVPTVVFRRT